VSSIRIIVGGGGERRTLAIAARLGDGCNLPLDLGTLDRKLAIFRQHCAAAGRDPAQAEVIVLDMPVIGRDREEASSIVEKPRGRASAAPMRSATTPGRPRTTSAAAGCCRARRADGSRLAP